jgi:hypothetical protein
MLTTVVSAQQQVMKMDWLNFPNIISFIIAFCAVIALFVQYRAATKQLRLQNFTEYTKRYQDIILNFPENVNEPTFMLDKLGEEVRNKTMRYMRVYFDLCYEEFILHKKKFIDDEFWELWNSGMEAAFGKPAFKEAWQKISKDTSFGGQFVDFVKGKMESP